MKYAVLLVAFFIVVDHVGEPDRAVLAMNAFGAMLILVYLAFWAV
jgi:hypothetical protein